jgi:hypothetical protein
MILAMKALTSQHRDALGQKPFRDRQRPLVKGLSVRVLAFGTVKFR